MDISCLTTTPKGFYILYSFPSHLMIFLVKTSSGKVMSSGVDPRDRQCRDSDGQSASAEVGLSPRTAFTK